MGSLMRYLPLLLLATCIPQARSFACYDVFSKDDYPFCKLLSPTYALHWKVESGYITFGIYVQGSWGWVGLGISEGGMMGADIYVLKRDESASAGSVWSIGDYFSTQFAEPVLDDQQDITKIEVSQQTYQTVAIIQRKLDTCDHKDIEIFEDTDQNVIFAYGNKWGYHGPVNRGWAQVRLNPANFNSSATSNVTASYYLDMYAHDPPDLKPLQLTMNKYQVPPTDTFYACTNFAVPADKSYQAIRYQFLQDSGLAHHAIVYMCSSKPKQLNTSYTCFDMPVECSTPFMFWAPGVSNYSTPPVAGIPFGQGSVQYMALQIHYNNVNITRGKVDSSGFIVYYTAQLRKYNLGVLQLGTIGFSIPPNQTDYSITANVCPSDCTQRFNTTLTLVANFFHMHEIGKSITTRHIRNGTELQPLGWRNYWDFDYQGESTVLPDSRLLYPGDQLITQCSYNSVGQLDTVSFGLASSDEMCFNFLHYYPAMPNITECTTYSFSNQSVTSCANGEDLASLDMSGKAAQALVQSGKLLVDSGMPTFTPYLEPCLAAGPPAVIHTGAGIAAILVVTIVLSIAGVFLWHRYGKEDDPERQQLLSVLEQQVKEEYLKQTETLRPRS